MTKGERKKISRKYIAVLAVMLACAAILATGTLAYFVAEETAYNVITTGVLDMLLVEETSGGQPWPDDGISGVMPGAEVDKIPQVQNIGTVDFYTRIRVTLSAVAEDKKTPLDTEPVELNINTEFWTEKDGWYYYRESVAPGGETEPLFTVVRFDEQMGNEYQNAEFYIDLKAQAVQSKNNDEGGPLSAEGWPVAE